MALEEMIAAEELCMHYQVPMSFLQNLQNMGLLQCNVVEEKLFIGYTHLGQLEKMIHLHYDLDINIEGIEAILHLLEKINHLQQQVLVLRNSTH
ncbi:chaperone modulator CbpM [Deminuibacter soli]|uniref:MerR family transcriptional regulator n=1 Tax=Deminuibacter soli TaxID=2291815 RepID=A0A3E1NDN5_9BACT|nr:chaperone modulator CbpM [Deminuibacter soli]RFM25954.1 MerR family transcriptional regulator [Deminuibacter soli]